MQRFDVLGPRDGAQRNAAEKVVEMVNAAVRTGTVEDNRWGTGETQGFWFTVAGDIPSVARLVLIKDLQKAGWKVQGIFSSEENGERPGLTTVVLRYPE
jgi:hypothetical protein